VTVGAGWDQALEVDEMSVPATNATHEFVVAPELAEVAERLGVPLHERPRPGMVVASVQSALSRTGCQSHDHRPSGSADRG
jgi:hypothetical protein